MGERPSALCPELLQQDSRQLRPSAHAYVHTPRAVHA